MSLDEVQDIMQRAMALWKEAGENPSEHQYYDFVSLVKLAINKADEPIGFLHSVLAQVHFDVNNFADAWQEAENALSLDGDDFKAQLIKTIISYAIYADATEESQNKKMGFMDTLSVIISIPKGYQQGQAAGRKLGEAMGSKQYAKQAQATFFQELKNSVDQFKRICSQGIEASDFIGFSRRLMKLGDGISETGIKLDHSLNLYALVANIPTDNISFETDEEKNNIKTTQLIAQGRLTL